MQMRTTTPPPIRPISGWRKEVVKAARDHGCDAIVMATHARQGLAKRWHGSETEEVLTRSSIPTLVYR